MSDTLRDWCWITWTTADGRRTVVMARRLDNGGWEPLPGEVERARREALP